MLNAKHPTATAHTSHDYCRLAMAVKHAFPSQAAGIWSTNRVSLHAERAGGSYAPGSACFTNDFAWLAFTSQEYPSSCSVVRSTE
jgi:hypothetical protein